MGLECYRIGDLVLNAGTQEVKRDGAVVPVPRLSFKLLLALARHAPNVVSTDQLEQEVWEGLVVDRGTVNKRVLLLRKALDDGQEEDPYIAVIRGSGYRLVAPVERIDSAAIETGRETGVGRDEVRIKDRIIRNIPYWILAIVAVLATYHSVQHSLSENHANEPVTAAVVESSETAMPIKQNSIAVLPFVDLSNDKTHQYLGDGIAEEVINLLSRMDSLEVAARTSSFAFKDSMLTTEEIAPRLRVGKILEGSIRHSEGRIRVTAQLIDVQTGFHIWSQNYDRAFDEVFEVEDDIAASIAQSLKLTIDERSTAVDRRSTTNDFEAFELYLQGRELFNNRIELRAEGLHRSLEFFTRAATKDPGFARAHAGIALVSWVLTTYDDSLDKESYFQRAEASAGYALELDPESTDAMGALAGVYAARGEVDKAVTLFDQIREIGSNESYLAHWEAMLHLRLGYFEELIEPLTRLYRLDPLNEYIGWSLAAALNFSGRPREATDILEDLEHFNYRQYALGLCALNEGDYEGARELLRDARMRSGILPAEMADLLVDALEDPSLTVGAVGKILVAVEGGELEKLVAFEALLLLGSPAAFDLAIDPVRDVNHKQLLAQVWNNWGTALRQDWRFKAWLDKLGYETVWRKHTWPDRCKPTGADDFECI
ncbi:MAG: winged helix-turn-helix domain-containing protein [Xanthomonadales bacterium]|nr:winged helix-turn-helix domain-containing protein [Xanthomonadales bacterium]